MVLGTEDRTARRYPNRWRRLIVPETVKLPKLHKIFQIALGWTNSHLHKFNISGVKYADPDPAFAEECEHVDQKKVALVKALGLDSRCFDDLYDFGDSWCGDQSLTSSPRSRAHFDHRSDRANACPPEDVGGVHGYADFRAAIVGSEHEDHGRFLEWIGGSIDPTRFGLDATNLAFSKIKA